MSGGVDNFNDVIPAPITLPRESDGVFVLKGVIPSRSANETQQVHTIFHACDAGDVYITC